jgi:hypothetical protein
VFARSWPRHGRRWISLGGPAALAGGAAGPTVRYGDAPGTPLPTNSIAARKSMETRWGWERNG